MQPKGHHISTPVQGTAHDLKTQQDKHQHFSMVNGECKKQWACFFLTHIYPAKQPKCKKHRPYVECLGYINVKSQSFYLLPPLISLEHEEIDEGEETLENDRNTMKHLTNLWTHQRLHDFPSFSCSVTYTQSHKSLCISSHV